MNKAHVIAIHIQGPLTPSGGDVQLGTRLKNGAVVYITGKRARKMR